MGKIDYLMRVKKDLMDFEACLDRFSDRKEAYDKWLKEYRLLGVVEVVRSLISQFQGVDDIKRELNVVYRMIEEEIAKESEEEGG